MHELSTEYLGLKLKNPLIASSSGLTENLQKIQQLEAAGIGAVVIKSLFEEQIVNQANVMSSQEDYPEANDYINQYIQSHEIEKYLDTIRSAKRECRIPIMASLNCVGKGEWVDFAQRIEQAGADALEVNIFLLPTDPYKPASSYEAEYISTVEAIIKRVTLPIAVKLSRNFTNPLHIIQQLHFLGVKGCVLFNRFYEPDINTKTQRVESASIFSTQHELAPTLRWLALASAKLETLQLAVSTGIHTGEDAAKAILAGATAVQICTTLYQHSPAHVPILIQQLESAMETVGAESLDTMRGRLNYMQTANPALFERSQFMRYFSDKA